MKRRTFLIFLSLFTAGLCVFYLYGKTAQNRRDRFLAKKSTRKTVALHTTGPTVARSSSSVTQLRFAVVTGFSENHFEEAEDMIASVQKFLPSTPIIVFNLGISEKTLQKLNLFCNVQVRSFDFSAWPSHVKNVGDCAWKPIAVGKVLREFSLIFYADASVRLFGDFRPTLYPLLDDVVPVVGESTAPSGPAGSYTHDGTLAYFHVNRVDFEDVEMFAATYFVAKRTKEVMSNIIEPWVDCALHSDCISPVGAHKWPCRAEMQKTNRNAFIGCHRYDQSALTILLFKAFGRERYAHCLQDSRIRSLVKINRYKTSFYRVQECGA